MSRLLSPSPVTPLKRIRLVSRVAAGVYGVSLQADVRVIWLYDPSAIMHAAFTCEEKVTCRRMEDVEASALTRTW